MPSYFILFYFLDEIDSLSLMPHCKLQLFIIFYNTRLKCYSFSLTYMIKVSGLNVIYKTFDFIIPLGVWILNTLKQTCF